MHFVKLTLYLFDNFTTTTIFEHSSKYIDSCKKYLSSQSAVLLVSVFVFRSIWAQDLWQSFFLLYTHPWKSIFTGFSTENVHLSLESRVVVHVNVCLLCCCDVKNVIFWLRLQVLVSERLNFNEIELDKRKAVTADCMVLRITYFVPLLITRISN